MKRSTRVFLKAAVCSLLISFASTSFALTYGQALDELDGFSGKGGLSESNHGFLCEKLALMKMEETVDGDFIASSISYGINGRVVGELDLVVFDRDGVAEQVIEVKCKRKYGSAVNLANKQLSRFQNVAGRCDYKYWDKSGKTYDCFSFKNREMIFNKMSYGDAINSGFDLSFDLTRDEVLRLVRSIR